MLRHHQNDMCRENIHIEDRLHSAGYKTERIGGVVNVSDPVHASVCGSKNLEFSHSVLREIRTTRDAWKFIQERA